MSYSDWLHTLKNSFSEMTDSIAAYLPHILVSAVVLVTGWLIARFARFVVIRFMSGLDHLWHRVMSRRGLAVSQSRYPPARIIGEVFFWVILLLVITLVAEVLGLKAFVSWLSQVVSHVPLLISGLLIVLAGYIISTLARDLVASSAASARLIKGDLLGRIVQAFILTTAVVIGVDQIGIDITFLSIIAGIVLASILGAMALAFALGAKAHVANIIAGYHMRQYYRTGDLVKIHGIEGKILKVEETRVLLDTEEGRVDMPTKFFDTETVVLIERGD